MEPQRELITWLLLMSHSIFSVPTTSQTLRVHIKVAQSIPPFSGYSPAKLLYVTPQRSVYQQDGFSISGKTQTFSNVWKHFLVVIIPGKGGATSIWWVISMGAAKYSLHRKVLHDNKLSGIYIIGAAVYKPTDINHQI